MIDYVESANRDGKEMEPSHLPGRDVKWCSYLGNSLVVPQKANPAVTI